MSLFRQLWNGVWHFETPQDETIRWIVECGLGEMICLGILFIPAIAIFAAYCHVLEGFYWTKPQIRFEVRHTIVEQTGDFSVYDMTDEELEALHDAEIDF